MAKHCDDYIDDVTQPECLRRFLDFNRLPAALKYPTHSASLDKVIEEHHDRPIWRDPVPTLFARHEGRPVRVTMASRFGDVGITEDLDAEHGYGKRVAVEELTNFSAERPCVWGERVYTNGPARVLAVDGAWGGGFMGNRAERRAAAARARRA